MSGVIGLVWLIGCRQEPADGLTPVDLVSVLGAGEVRAGVVTDPAALFGGVSAEGRPGDVKLYNDRAQFIVQAPRMSSYYLSVGGGVIDADLVRGPGEPGRDIVDEWMPAVSVVHVLEPTEIEVLADGSDGSPARVVVRGVEAALSVVEGVLEAPGFIQPLGVQIETEYILAPDSPLLEVRTTVTADQDTAVSVGDVLIGAPEVASPWWQRTGLAGDGGRTRGWSAFVDHDREVAVATLALPGVELASQGAQVLSELTELVASFGPNVPLATGEATTHVRYWGVARDLATLTDAVSALGTAPTTRVEGTVTADDGPVAGAWVGISVEGEPYTLAVSGEDGSFGAQVPAGAAVHSLAIGEGTRRFLDLPAGAAAYGAYGVESTRSVSLAALSAAGPSDLKSEGRGRGGADPLHLGVPAIVRLVSDGLPFTAWLDGGAEVRDEAWSLGRPSGHAAVGFARDGQLDLAVEPGTWRLVAHRGMRYGVVDTQVVANAGEVTTVQVDLPRAYEHPGWILGDPHSHAAPSGDAAISMEERLVVHAASGVQLHFGTDHDQVADYSPLLAALGLTGVLGTVVADEVSPPLRGHFNVFPVESRDQANGGAWTWWEDIPTSTDDMLRRVRELYASEIIVQSNHPLDSGMGSSAGWRPGEVADANRWSSGIQAVEVMNSGDYSEYLEFYLDLIGHGILVAAHGVSDSHGHLAGHAGMSCTFLGVGVDDPALVDPPTLVEAIKARRTIVSRGLFLDVDVDPGQVVQAGTAVHVEVKAAPWIHPSRIVVLRDGVEVQRIDGTAADVVLQADVDAAFVIIAEGDEPMLPVDGNTPWAMTSAYLVDVGGDGWTAPEREMPVGQ